MDVHFIIRNAFSGAMLFGALVLGVWIEDPRRAAAVLKQLNEHGEFAVAATPVVGILVQGIYLTAASLFKGEMFNDPARKMVSTWGRATLSSYRSDDAPNFHDEKQVCNDAVFVWLYHERAQEHLIEWARRRRSYHYLGMSCPIAAVLGLPLGALFAKYYEQVASWDAGSRLWFVSVVTLIWAVPAVWLAIRMWKDANQMEAAWASFTLREMLLKGASSQPPAVTTSASPQ